MVRVAMTSLPTGTVTFLFTDVEGSTRLLHELGAERYAEALAEHRRVVREACVEQAGAEVDTQGDAFFIAFPSAAGALAAAHAMTRQLGDGPIRLRIGLHTGTPLLTEEGYVGKDVHFAARVAAAGHGGQILVSKATRELLDSNVTLTDLGEHRLKDIAEPVTVYQLGSERFPPLRTISNTNLPRPASSFVGREHELDEVLSRLEQGARLLTLTGPGGSGKTRLALEAAATLVPAYKAGVFWVGLAALRDPSLVSEQIAQVLGAKDGLASHIAERELLLLLDNLEQVVEAAPELSALLQACPNLTLLCTSRELLRIQGEVEYQVPPLASPEAVALFGERSGLEASEEITELCGRLDNLPLAVELAAARTSVLSPAEIRERLSQRLDLLSGGRDSEARQQTLRATIAWSYDLLSEEERRLFRALSVFAGGCTLEAAEEVADADLDTLQSLAEKSLLRFSASDAGSRYWMLETIREYAGERLEEMGEADLRRRHAGCALRLAERARSQVRGGPEQLGWLDRLEQERDNFRATLAWAQQADVELGLRLACALSEFWDLRGPVREAREWLSGLLERTDGEPLELRWDATSRAGDFAYVAGDADQARTFGEESLRLARQMGDSSAITQALHDLGEVAVLCGDYEHARDLMEQAVKLATEEGRPPAGTIANLGELALVQGDYERAWHHMMRALDLLRAQNRTQDVALVLSNLAQVELARNRHAEALAFVRESAALAGKVGFPQVQAACLVNMAALLAAKGDGAEGASLLGAFEKSVEDIGYRPAGSDEKTYAATVDAVAGLLGDDARTAAAAAGARMSLEEAVAFGFHALRRGS